MDDSRQYDAFVTYVPERENGQGKRVDAMFRIVVRCECGKENRFAVFEPWVNKVKDGSIPEAKGIRLKDNPDWRRDGQR